MSTSEDFPGPFGNPAQYFEGQPLVTDPRYLPQELRTAQYTPEYVSREPAQYTPEYVSREPTTGNVVYSKTAIGAVTVASILLVAVIAAIVLYAVLGANYTSNKVKEDLENGQDIDAKLGTLFVVNNTILGDSPEDDLEIGENLDIIFALHIVSLIPKIQWNHMQNFHFNILIFLETV